jgi:uncharacterized protein (DUF1810 family)
MENKEFDLTRFLEAQNQMYLKALAEIKNGRKQTHWMWFIFPQLKGLGRSATAQFYGIQNLAEATAYLAHPILGSHLVEISSELLNRQQTANDIFGSPDDLKLRSSMTLFSNVKSANPVFSAVLQQFFDGKPDVKTLQILKNHDVI